MRKSARIMLSFLLMISMLFTFSGARAQERRLYKNEDFIYEITENDTITVHFYIGEGDKITVPSHIDSVPVESIEAGAFYDTQVKEVVVSEGIITLKNEAFFNCRGLEEVSLPSTLENVGTGVFRFCTNLKKVNFAENCKELGSYMFYGCVSLETAALPKVLTSIPEGTFSYCQSLRRIDLHEGIVTVSDCAFFASGLEKIELPLTLEYIQQKAFAQSVNLTVIEAGKESFELVAKDAFDGCPSKLPGYNSEIEWTDPTEPSKSTDPAAPTEPVPPVFYPTETSTDLGICGTDATETATVELSSPTETQGYVTPEGFYIGDVQDFICFENTLLTETESSVYSRRQQLSSLAWNVRAMGDADNNNQVNIRDATAIQKFIASLIDKDDPCFNYKNADVDTDGKVTVRDATMIQKYIAGLIERLY